MFNCVYNVLVGSLDTGVDLHYLHEITEVTATTVSVEHGVGELFIGGELKHVTAGGQVDDLGLAENVRLYLLIN